MASKISVIIPIYNVEKYLKECVESILNQTYKNLEIILINDGTRDNCGIICDDYAKKDLRIKAIHQKNMGLSGARNTGLKNSTGDFIAFVDSDDFINKEMFENMLLVLKENNADIVECGTIYCKENGEYLSENTTNEMKIYRNELQMKELLMNRNITTTSWGKLYKRELLEKFEFPLGKYHEDVFTTYKLLYLSKKTVVLNKGFYYYRQVKGSIMNSDFNLKHLDSIEATIERSNFIKKNYPQYVKYDYANIVYFSCKVYERIILSEFYDKKIIGYLQKLIKKYLIYFFIYSKSKKTTKLFAFVCCLNMNLCRKIYAKLRLQN